MLNELLYQGELASHCSFIGLNYAAFNSQCLSNAKCLFYQKLAPKHHGQVNFDKKAYQYSVLALFTTLPHNTTTATNTGKQISDP